jgi:putative endonuclease
LDLGRPKAFVILARGCRAKNPESFWLKPTHASPQLLRLHHEQSPRTLYAGVTNDLERRVGEHKEGKPGSFTVRYNVNRLVYFEEFKINQAIAREKEIKSMTQRQKIKLIESINPEWHDLSQE